MSKTDTETPAEMRAKVLAMSDEQLIGRMQDCLAFGIPAAEFTERTYIRVIADEHRRRGLAFRCYRCDQEDRMHHEFSIDDAYGREIEGEKCPPEELHDNSAAMLHFAATGCEEFAPVVSEDGDVYCENCGADLPEDEQVIESPSGWSYRRSQENGDQVDCRYCGNPINDDFPIENDPDGFAYHADCYDDARRVNPR